jgi:hypothetical protein
VTELIWLATMIALLDEMGGCKDCTISPDMEGRYPEFCDMHGRGLAQMIREAKERE